jgi:hypothetical protein
MKAQFIVFVQEIHAVQQCPSIYTVWKVPEVSFKLSTNLIFKN